MSVYLNAVQIGRLSLVARVENGAGAFEIIDTERTLRIDIVDFDGMIEISAFFTRMLECNGWDRNRPAVSTDD